MTPSVLTPAAFTRKKNPDVLSWRLSIVTATQSASTSASRRVSRATTPSGWGSYMRIAKYTAESS